MNSRRGRLNWSNLEVHISDSVIEKQHCFNNPNSLSSRLTSSENIIKEEKETSLPPPSPTPPIKKSWMPKKGVGEIQVEHFVGNFMLTGSLEKFFKFSLNSSRFFLYLASEQCAIDNKYNKQTSHIDRSKDVPTPKPIRISNRLPSMRDTPISIRTTNLSVGQHLLNVFVCHVESYSCVYIMFGDDYNRATKLFQDMNSCDELIQPSTTVFE